MPVQCGIILRYYMNTIQSYFSSQKANVLLEIISKIWCNTVYTIQHHLPYPLMIPSTYGSTSELAPNTVERLQLFSVTHSIDWSNTLHWVTRIPVSEIVLNQDISKSTEFSNWNIYWTNPLLTFPLVVQASLLFTLVYSCMPQFKDNISLLYIKQTHPQDII